MAFRSLCSGEDLLLVNGYAQYLLIQTSTISHVISTFPTDFIYCPKTLSEIYRVLNPGGKLLILPAAWITGSRWYDRLAAWLFQITGQAPTRDSISTSIFHQAGFHCQIERINLESSFILLVVANKPVEIK